MELQVEESIKEHIQKPIDKWNSKDLLLHFARRWKHLRGIEFLIPDQAWSAFMSRIKTFQRSENLDSKQYREFIDRVFDELFSQEGFAPSFGCIVSQRVYWTLNQKGKVPETDFNRMKQALYDESSLFSKL